MARLATTAAVPIVDVEVPAEAQDDDSATLAVSEQAELTTADFVIRQITSKLSGHEFEGLVAHLLECMGYTARVTPRSGDGGGWT